MLRLNRPKMSKVYYRLELHAGPDLEFTIMALSLSSDGLLAWLVTATKTHQKTFFGLVFTYLAKNATKIY